MSDTITAPRRPASRQRLHQVKSNGPAPVRSRLGRRSARSPRSETQWPIFSTSSTRSPTCLAAKDPGISAGLKRLVEQAAEPGRTEQPLFRTQVAYMLQDVEKLAGAKIASVPAELRTELTKLAGSSPGLENKQMEAPAPWHGRCRRPWRHPRYPQERSDDRRAWRPAIFPGSGDSGGAGKPPPPCRTLLKRGNAVRIECAHVRQHS